MQHTPSGPLVPTNVVANGASADVRAAGAPSRYGEAGLRERHRLADLGLATSRTPLVRGRDAELASIGVQLDRVRSGVGAVVLVEGEPGIGKTRLLAEADRVAGRLGFRVGAGAAEPGAGVVELAPLMTALFDGSRPLLERSGLAELRSLPEQRYWLLQDLETLLERAALDGPLLISLDDLQWADSGTAAALLALPVRLADLPVAWILAFRPNQGSAQVLSMIEHLHQSGAERIVLGPLDDAAVAQVAEDVIDAEPDDVLLDLVKGAHGSPFVLMELLSGLRDEDLIRVVAGRAELVEARLPRRVAFTMRERLRSVTAPAREAAGVAASLGRRFSFNDLANMLDRSPATLLGPVEELIDSGVLVESGDRLAFRHDVTREAVRESVPVSARRALDRQAADVLLAAGAAPVEVAAQIAASAEPGDEQAISILLRAGEALASTDPGAGADLSRRALELAPRDHNLRGPLLAQSAVLLHSAGRVDEARAFADTHLRDALPIEQEAEVLLGIAGMFRVPPDARVAAGRQALALPELPAHLRAQHLAGLFHNLLVGGRIEEAKAIRAETTAAVKASGDANSSFALALADTVIAYADGRYDDGARDDRTGGARRHRHDRLGPRTPRAGVALRDADRAGPGGRITRLAARRHRRRAARQKRAGPSASSRSGGAGSCTSWAGRTTPARSSKASSGRSRAIASSALLMLPESSPWGGSRRIRGTGACSSERRKLTSGLPSRDSTPNFRRQAEHRPLAIKPWPAGGTGGRRTRPPRALGADGSPAPSTSAFLPDRRDRRDLSRPHRRSRRRRRRAGRGRGGRGGPACTAEPRGRDDRREPRPTSDAPRTSNIEELERRRRSLRDLAAT